MTQTIIIDNGSGYIKSGFAGNDKPSFVFSSCFTTNGLEIDFDDEYPDQKNGYVTKCPIKNGIVTEWEDICKVWEHTFEKKLRVRPETCNVLITDSPISTIDDRKHMAEILFEKFNIKGLYISMDAIMSMYACGLTSGLVVDCGDSLCTSVPISQGHIVDAIQVSRFGGQDLTRYMSKLLHESGIAPKHNLEGFKFAKKIKEQFGYIPRDFTREMEVYSDVQKAYRLPDGQEVTLGNQRFRCPEALFKPALIGLKEHGVQETITKSIKRCSADIQKSMLCKIIVCGGSCQFEGFKERLRKELSSSFNEQIRFTHVKDSQNCVFLGASVFATIPSFKDIIVHRDAYNEIGDSLIDQKLKNQ